MNYSGQVTTILGLLNNVGGIEYLVELIEHLEIMNGWTNGDMLMWNMRIQAYLIIAL